MGVCDRIVVLNFGTVLGSGTPDEIRAHPEVIAANLRLGRANRQQCLELFPELRDRLRVKAGHLSGGEQQMLAVGRALSRSPKVLLADRVYVMRRGRVEISGRPRELAGRLSDIADSYLGRTRPSGPGQ